MALSDFNARQHNLHKKRYSLNIDYTHSGNGLPSSPIVERYRDAITIKKMDSVLGIGVAETTTFGHDSLASKIVSLCKQLHQNLLSLNANNSSASNRSDPRLELPTDTRDYLVKWLTSDPRGLPFTQLENEKLVQQLKTLEKELDACRCENDNLKKDLQRFMASGGSQNGISHVRTRSNSSSVVLPPAYNDLSLTRGESLGKTSSLTALSNRPGSSSNFKRQKGLRESFRKAFSRKGNCTKDIGQDSDINAIPLNSRAQRFNSLTGMELVSWMSSVGLEMYAELISQLVVTGERLGSISANTDDLTRLGILNILHCKKLKLAVEDAVASGPSPLSFLDHNWVADWLIDVGLPQYQQPFLDAKIDGKMLNHLSMEDLAFLKIDNPFHIASLTKAIQAFRLCGYDGNYLKLRPDKGGLKLLHWSCYHIIDWLKDIELDEYAEKLQGTGINGPIIALEANFTHDSLAKAIGISANKGLIIAHLGEKFLELIGPTCAQRKVDAMQAKHFTPIDPLEQPPKTKNKKSAKRSKTHIQEETYLCPPTEVPTLLRLNNYNEPLRNLTVSSDTGQRRSAVYSPSPVEQQAPSPPCPTPPLVPHPPPVLPKTVSIAPTLAKAPPTPSSGPPPPPPPPPPPIVPPLS